MKLTLPAILTFSIILFIGCYDEDKNATVRIKLGNIPIAQQVEKKSLFDKVFSMFVKDACAQQRLSEVYGVYNLHFAAFSGNTLLTNKSINVSNVYLDGKNSYAELSVPAGDNLTILVLGENGSNLITYYGSINVNLQSGENAEVSIAIKTIANASAIQAITSTVHSITWKNLYGVSKYYIEVQDQIDPFTYNPVWEGLGTGYINTYTVVPYYRMRIQFGFINRFSDNILFQAI